LLARLVARLKQGCAGLPWNLMPSDTAIQPLVIGATDGAMHVADALLQRGLLVPAIRPPTVPEGTARLRISLSAGHTLAQVDQLVDALQEIGARA
jgi:8-amino-7-oxononanoate synthase